MIEGYDNNESRETLSIRLELINGPSLLNRLKELAS
jgi:hypothetical protein